LNAGRWSFAFVITTAHFLPVTVWDQIRENMRYIGSFKKLESETWSDYRSRLAYAVLRRVSSRHREQYRLERLVGPENCWDQLGQYQFNILTSLGLKPNQTLLDAGCGPLTVGLRMIPYLNAGNYVGIDLREEPLREAYRLAAINHFAGKNPTFIKSGTFGKGELGGRTFDFIWMSQLSYHLTEEQITGLFEHAKNITRSGASLVFDVINPATSLPSDASWSGFKFHLRALEFYAELGNRFSFQMAERGRIENFGYPKQLHILKNNILLEFKRCP
jgi:SAM-dependent methyltransferase